MDGNGRWATGNSLPRFKGHKKGAYAVKNTVLYCLKNKIPFLTLYAFSKENWQRPKDEVSYLLALFSRALQKEKDFLIENNIALKILGDLKGMSKFLRNRISDTADATVQNVLKTEKTNLTLSIAIDYSSRWEILQATKKIAEKVYSNDLSPKDITEDTFNSYLQTSNKSLPLDIIIPDPDLLIRTGEEKRLSNFLLWQLAYTELYFTDTLWPDCNDEVLDNAIKFFYNRERRYGKTSEQIKAL